MGIFGSKQSVVPTTLACTVPQSKAGANAGAHLMHLLPMEDSVGKECADVRSTISSFAPLGFLESAKTTQTERGMTRHTYTYAWPPPRDETIAGLLAGIWKHTTTKRVVTQRDDTGGGFAYTAVGGRRVVPLKQVISGWYPVPIETIEVEADVGHFKWEYVKEALEKKLTRERWDAWRNREAASYSASGATGGARVGMRTTTSTLRRKLIIVATWENTVGAILLHYKRVTHEAICTLSQQCREAQTRYGFREKGAPTKRAPTKRAKSPPGLFGSFVRI